MYIIILFERKLFEKIHYKCLFSADHKIKNNIYHATFSHNWLDFQLETALTYSNSIKPICLANGEIQNFTHAIVSGWGMTSGTHMPVILIFIPNGLACKRWVQKLNYFQAFCDNKFSF